MSGELSKLLKRNGFHLIMFGYVRAVKKNLPTVSVIDVIKQFMDEFEITHEEMNLESLRTTYDRMNKEFIEHLRNERRGKI